MQVNDELKVHNWHLIDNNEMNVAIYRHKTGNETHKFTTQCKLLINHSY